FGALADTLIEHPAVSLYGPDVDDRQRPADPLGHAQCANPAGIEAMPPPATPASWPTRSPASRPAREWATTAAQVAAKGSTPRAISAAMTPVRTSPGPAVASWRR